MNLYLESLFVGIYCVILYFLILCLSINDHLISTKYFLFLFGFLKHFLGYFLGIHNYWCKLHKNNSTNNNNNNNALNIKFNFKFNLVGSIGSIGSIGFYSILLTTSLLEGILFVIIGGLIEHIFKYKISKNNLKIDNLENYLYFFFLGIFMHIFSEWIGIHTFYIHFICL